MKRKWRVVYIVARPWSGHTIYAWGFGTRAEALEIAREHEGARVILDGRKSA